MAALIGNIQPVFLGVLADSFHLDPRQLGIIGGVELGGSCLASLTAPWWFPRVALRRAAGIAIVVSVSGNLLTGWADSYQQLLVLRFGIGLLGSGFLYALTLGLIGGLAQADRIIAIVIVCHVLSLALGLAGVPLLMNVWGLQGVALTLALLFASCLPLLRWLPAQVEPCQPALGGKSFEWLPAALLVCLIVFATAVGGLWAFLERIGHHAGFERDAIGSALALSGLVGGAGAVIAAVIGTRYGRLLPIVSALAIQTVTCYLLAIRGHDWITYVVGAAFFNLAWNLALPYLMGAIAAADTRSRFMVLVPAAQSGGYALGAVLTGLVIKQSFSNAAWLAMALFILCLGLAFPLVRRVSTG